MVLVGVGGGLRMVIVMMVEQWPGLYNLEWKLETIIRSKFTVNLHSEDGYKFRGNYRRGRRANVFL